MAGSGIKGSFEALRALARRFRGLDGPAFKNYMSNRIGAAALKQVADEFRGERNSYGEGWAPLKQERRRKGRRKTASGAQRRGKILQDTGRLRSSFFIRNTPNGFAVCSVVKYAVHHQFGTRNMQAREMLPSAYGGIGSIWGPALSREGKRAMRDYMLGRA